MAWWPSKIEIQAFLDDLPCLNPSAIGNCTVTLLHIATFHCALVVNVVILHTGAAVPIARSPTEEQLTHQYCYQLIFKSKPDLQYSVCPHCHYLYYQQLANE